MSLNDRDRELLDPEELEALEDTDPLLGEPGYDDNDESIDNVTEDKVDEGNGELDEPDAVDNDKPVVDADKDESEGNPDNDSTDDTGTDADALPDDDDDDDSYETPLQPDRKSVV